MITQRLRTFSLLLSATLTALLLFPANAHAKKTAKPNVPPTQTTVSAKPADAPATSATNATTGTIQLVTAPALQTQEEIFAQLALSKYKTDTSNKYASIAYPTDEQAFVDEIKLSYPLPIRLIELKNFDAQIAVWKKHDLPLIARRLALEKPTADMEDAFERFRGMVAPIVQQEISVIQIFYFPDLKEACLKGLKFNGITYLPETDSVNVASYITMESPGEKTAIRIMPVVLMQKVADMIPEKMRLFNSTLRDMRWRLDENIYNTYCSRLYEIARPDIAATVDQSKFPLWLIDGMTNAIPIMVMRSHNPSLSFEQLLQSYANPPEGFSTLVEHMDLDTWALTRTANTAKTESDAYYYLAMLVVLDAIGENGESWVPEFFTRLRAENSPALAMPLLYSIYTNITGKELRDNAARVKARIVNK